MEKLTNEILENIISYSNNSNNILVSKRFRHASLTSFYFSPGLIYLACEVGDLDIIELFMNHKLKLNKDIDWNICVIQAIVNKHLEIIKYLINVIEFNDIVLKVTLYSSKEIARIILNKYIKKKIKKNSKLISKLSCKTGSHLRYVKGVPFSKYFLILTQDLNRGEFNNVICKIDLNEANKRFIKNVRNRNINFLINYQKACNLVGHFIEYKVLLSCIKYFNHTNDLVMIDHIKNLLSVI